MGLFIENFRVSKIKTKICVWQKQVRTIKLLIPFSGLHVFHLQGEVHQQLHRDSRISHPARNRSRTTHGSQFLGLLEKKKH